MQSGRSRINEQVDRMRVLKNLSLSILERPLLCVALMLFWTWLNLAFQGPLFFPSVELANGFLLSSWFAPIGAAALAYFGLGIWFKRTNYVIKKPWYLACVASFMALGALLCFLWINFYASSLSSEMPLLLYSAGSLFLGAGTALLMVEWGRIFGYLGPQQVLYHGIIAMLGSTLLVLVLSFMPRYVGQLVLVLIPLPLVFCLYKTLPSLPIKILFNHGLNAELKTPYKFLVTALIHGLSLGSLMGGFFVLNDQSTMSFLTAISFTVSAIVLLVTAISVKMDFNHLIYQVGFGITATGAFLFTCFGGLPILGISVQLVGFCYSHLVIWGLCSYLIKHFRLPATWVIAWPSGCLMLGQLIGGMTSNIFSHQDDISFWMQMMATGMVFILLMAALIMMSSKNLMTGWGMASPGNFVHAPTKLGLVIERLTIEKNLTPRESEICNLMACGRNRKIISAELVISEETTKSHISGLYSKLEIHSQQELLTLIEALTAEEEGREAGMAFK